MNKNALGNIMGGTVALFLMMVIIGILGLESEDSVMAGTPHWFIYWWSGMIAIIGSVMGGSE